MNLAHSHGIDAVEIRALEGELDLPKVLARRYGDTGRLVALTGASGTRVAVMGSSLRLIGATEAQIDDLVSEARWADALGARFIRIFDGGQQLGDADLDRVASLLDYWRECRARNGLAVDVLVETHDSLATPDNLQRFVDRDLGAALLWDTHHTWKIGKEDPATTWRRVAGQVMHIHVKDSVADATSRMGHRYVVPGTGDYPFPPLHQALASGGYDGLVSLEWEAYWHPELAPLADALASGIDTGWLYPIRDEKFVS